MARIVVALGGNALLKRGEALTATNQRANARIAAEALAPLCAEHEVVITHGNGPQVGLLALQELAYPGEDSPLDVLGAETEGAIGYMIEQELGNLLPFEKPLATLLTMVEVDPDDPAFQDPTKFVGQVYDEAEAKAEAAAKGWTVKPDGDKWRRVVPSPLPKRIFQLRPIQWLLEKGTVVIAAGGGGIPTMYEKGTPPARRRRMRDRQGPRHRAPRPRDRRHRLRLRHRRRRGLPRLGQARPAGDPLRPPPTPWTRTPSPPAPWARRSRPPRTSPAPPAAAPSSAPSPTCPRRCAARRARPSPATPARPTFH